MGLKHSDLLISWKSNSTVQWEEKHENIANRIKGQHSRTPLDLFPTLPLQWSHIYSFTYRDRLGLSLRSPDLTANLLRERYIVCERFYAYNSLDTPLVVARFMQLPQQVSSEVHLDHHTILFAYPGAKHEYSVLFPCSSRVSPRLPSVLKIFSRPLLQHCESKHRGTFFSPSYPSTIPRDTVYSRT